MFSTKVKHIATYALACIGLMSALGVTSNNALATDTSKKLTPAQRQLLESQSSKSGTIQDCYRIYDSYTKKLRNVSDAFKLCNKWAKEEDPKAMFILGLIYGYGQSVEQNFILSSYWLDKAVQKKYSLAYYFLGQMYIEGKGVGQDPKHAFELFSQGANSGDPNSIYALSQMYGNGIGTVLDQKEYIKYLDKAAIAKNKKAQFEAGVIFYQGRIAPQDIKKALSYLEGAVAQGYAPAQFTLGMIYFKDNPQTGIKANPQKSFDLIRRSAQQDYSVAQLQLGRIYEKGLLGQQKNENASLLWYSLSCNNDLPDACSEFSRLQDNRMQKPLPSVAPSPNAQQYKGNLTGRPPVQSPSPAKQ